MTCIPPFRSLLLGWLLSFLGWGLVAGLLGAAQVLDHQSALEAAWHDGVREWLPWAIFTPLLFCLTLRLPLDREHLAAALPTHLLLAAAALFGMHFWRSAPEGNGPPGMPPPPPPPAWDRPPPPPPGPPNDGPPGSPGPRGPLFHLLRADLPIYLMILSAAHAALFFRREQERAASLAQARLDALRMQLQPHFLFNYLNTIAGLVHEEPDRAEELIISLSELLRLTLSVAGEAELPLVREMEFVGRYMAIMHARFEGKLTFEVEFAPELKTALVPAFLLQPLVEEAVQHELQLNRARRLCRPARLA